MAEPLPLAMAIVRGPGQCWLTLMTSSRSSCSAREGLARIPTRFSAPRKPTCAGVTAGAAAMNDLRACRGPFVATGVVAAGVGTADGGAACARAARAGAAGAAKAGGSGAGSAAAGAAGAGVVGGSGDAGAAGGSEAGVVEAKEPVSAATAGADVGRSSPRHQLGSSSSAGGSGVTGADAGPSPISWSGADSGLPASSRGGAAVTVPSGCTRTMLEPVGSIASTRTGPPTTRAAFWVMSAAASARAPFTSSALMRCLVFPMVTSPVPSEKTRARTGGNGGRSSPR